MLSKVAEKVIGKNLIRFLVSTHSFGDNQWAFTQERSARDLVTALVMKWVLAFCSGQKIGAHLSDISGAFDKVYKEYLLGKLQSMGVAEVYMNFLHEYLAPRRARVAVEGALSESIQIMNSVFQGTVLGPPLWNAFFADVALPARSCNGKEAMIADDLNVCHEFHRNAEYESVMATLRSCHNAVHA